MRKPLHLFSHIGDGLGNPLSIVEKPGRFEIHHTPDTPVEEVIAACKEVESRQPEPPPQDPAG